MLGPVNGYGRQVERGSRNVEERRRRRRRRVRRRKSEQQMRNTAVVGDAVLPPSARRLSAIVLRVSCFSICSSICLCVFLFACVGCGLL